MADKTSIAVEVEVKGVEQSIESVKDLKNAIKAAKDEQVKAAAAFGQGSEEYQNASKKLGELKDSMDDLNDSTQSLRGSGVESLSSSFGMLGDGFKNLDLDKIKTGFKGIGSAMSAIPLMLIVSGITMLAEKFGIFEMITDAVVQVLYAFTDAIGLTNKADEKAAAEMIENAENVQKAKEEQYNAEIKKAQAAGQSTKQLELDKLKSTEDSIAKQFKAMEDLQNKKGKLNDEEQKQYDELQVNLLKASGDREAKEIANNKAKINEINAYNTFQSNIAEDLRVAKLSEKEKEIDAIRKTSTAKLKELDEKEVFDYKTTGDRIIKQIKENEETKKQINDLAQIEINKINSKYGNAAAGEAKKLRDEKLAAEIAAMKQIQDANIANEQDEQKRAIKKVILDQQRRFEEINKTVTDETLKAELLKESEKTFRNEMAAIHQASLDKQKAAEEKAAADKKALDAKTLAETNAENTAKAELDVLKQGNELNDLITQLQVKRDIDLQNEDLTASQKLLIKEKYAQDVHKLETDAEKAKQEEIVKIVQDSLTAAQNLSDIFFLFKKSKAEKGSKEETELARKQFNVNKALQIGMATIDGFKAITSILAQYPKFDGGIAMAAALVATGTASAATIAKIAATKFESGGGAPSAGGGAPSAPSIPPPPTIATPENNTNKTTSFDETGKNLNFQGTPTPTINVKASVGVDEITSKSNRVEVLENQSTF